MCDFTKGLGTLKAIAKMLTSYVPTNESLWGFLRLLVERSEG